MSQISAFRIARSIVPVCLLVLVPIRAVAGTIIVNPDDLRDIPTELLSMSLTGTGLLPLASDPFNLLGDSIDGFGFVNSQVTINESANLASTGFADIFTESGSEPIPVSDGDMLFVRSFFDVFFDVTIMDIDGGPGRDFAGMPDGATLMLPDLGPASMIFEGTCIANTSAVNFGCLPPEGQAYLGHFFVLIPLGGDINGNGENDVMKFTLAVHTVGTDTVTQIVGQTAFDTFSSSLDLDGAVSDPSADPPFSIHLTGPTTASQEIRVQPLSAPEPASIVLLVTGLAGLALRRRREQGS